MRLKTSGKSSNRNAASGWEEFARVLSPDVRSNKRFSLQAPRTRRARGPVSSQGLLKAVEHRCRRKGPAAAGEGPEEQEEGVGEKAALLGARRCSEKRRRLTQPGANLEKLLLAA